MRENRRRVLLRPAGLAYGLVMNVRNRLYDLGILKSWKAHLPVVSVGNLTAGGTGKTPMVDWIVRFYREAGIGSAIVSRGYRRRTKGVQLVSDGRKVLLGSRDAGDETAMLAANNPDTIVIVAEKRKEGVKYLLTHFHDSLPGVVVLDDAFQHRKIARDLDIVVINAGEPLDRAAMIPEGRLREPLQNLARADLFILGKITSEGQASAMAEQLRKTGKPLVKARVAPEALVPFAESRSRPGEKPPTEPVRTLAFAGIGSPDSFVKSLEHAGLQVVCSRFFGDHEPYSAAEIRKLVLEAEKKQLRLVTTEKDYFRLLGQPELLEMLAEKRCCFLRIRPVLYEGETILKEKLLSLAGCPE
jgi:tetraacyldisaccharide 4'-kinase